VKDRLRHLPFLDGLRAVAIVMVMAWHARGPHTSHYAQMFEVWIGVDAFFVLSGFLITTLLVQERQDRGSFGLRDFYARRVLRILPAYAVFLVGVLLYYGRAALRPVAMAAVYLNNYDHGYEWGFYHGYPGGLHAIGPTWSLCIEEQFYLLWPLALSWFCHVEDQGAAKPAAASSLPRALKLTLGVVAAILLWKTALLVHNPTVDDKHIYYPFQTRADSLLIGCAAALAWADTRLRERIRAGLSGPWTPAIVLVALAFAIQNVRTQEQRWLFNRIMAWVISLPMFSVLVATLILTLVVQPSSAPARFLSRPVMTWIGRLSYSLYLWHVFAIEETKQLGDAIARALPFAGEAAVELMTDGVGLALAVVLACLSYYLIERPFLRLKRRFEAAPRASAAAPAT
jgi:peptidoglycan/LPS O-acetylase OafA/YrhL